MSFYPPYLQVIKQTVTKDRDDMVYYIKVEGQHRDTGKKFSISFQQTIPEKERTPENMKKLNDSFRASLLIVKHHGGYPSDDVSEKDMKTMLDKLSTTSKHDIGIKVKDDPLPEYEPF